MTLTRQQIQIDLINRTPYQMRKIDLNEQDVIVKTIIGNITTWKHNDVSATLTIKLPSVFNAEYSYAKITEPNGVETRWFVLGKSFFGPNIWKLTLKRDLIRERWSLLKDAICEIERGYVNSSNPLYYKSEGISGNLTLGKRTKLLDSNLILAYVKTFQLQNNNGSAIGEGTWNVIAGIPGYNNAPIIHDTIPGTIKIFDAPNNQKTGYIKMRVLWASNILADYYGYIDSNGNSRVNDGAYVVNFTDNGSACATGVNGAPTQSALNKVKNSVNGFVSYANSSLNLGIQDLPNWMKETGGFGGNQSNNYPANFECVINKGTADAPRYYKLVFTDDIKNQQFSIADNDRASLNAFVSASGQSWGLKTRDAGAGSDKSVEGNFSYHQYTINEYFLSDTPASESIQNRACHTDFPATSVQTTAGAYSYNIYAFKVYDNGVGYSSNYTSTVQSNSGQMIVSALMGTGTGTPNSGGSGTIPSLAGQIVDIQMCPFDENSLHDLIDTVYDIKNGATGEIKVGEYYLLNSQDIEQFVDYDLTQWKTKGNAKSRVSLSQMRLLCPNNSSVATLNPDIISNSNVIRFRMNGTLYPYKPVYKVTPIATNNIIYANQDARDNMLVLGGDFSATQVSSAWSDYLVGNKNVEEAQQASIANQTLNQQLQHDFQLKSIQTQGSMSMISSMIGLIGGIAGMAAGGPVGGMMGVAGIAGGLMGMANGGVNSMLQREGLNLSDSIFANNMALNQKLFNLEMGNIKSMPNTIHKITNGSFDNDYSVMVEEYYSTDVEYQQFDLAIHRTGMNLNCIGKLEDYINFEYFVFGQIIESNIEDSSEVEAINNELKNGLKIVPIQIA